MIVLVTGYNGFIGRHLTGRLLEDGHTVFGIDDFSNSVNDFTELGEKWQKTVNNNLLYFDICAGIAEYKWLSEYILEETKGKPIDVIFHLAAKARVQASFDNPVEWHDTNVTGTLKLLEFAKVNKIKKFIFSSSSSVYGLDSKYGHSEHSKTYPLSPYALQKLQGEQLCQFYADTFRVDTVSLRYFNVYGENQPISGNYPQLIPILLDRWRNNLPFHIYGTGEHRRDFTYVQDVVDANLLAAEFGVHGIFNIGTRTNYSVHEICKMIDPSHPIEYLLARIEPSATLADNSKARQIMKWSPKMSLPEWIASQI